MKLALAPRLLGLAAIAVLVASVLLAARALSGEEDLTAGAPGADAPEENQITVAPPPAPADGEESEPFIDPFSYDPARQADFESRAARGFAHVLYARAPGGVTATAARVDRYRSRIERAAAASGVDPDVLEGLVFLESAGYPDIVAGGRDFTGAVGLTQILAETGQNLLGMRVDPAAAQRLTRRIARAEQRGDLQRANALRAQRRRVDERFDPEKALAGTGRYLQFAASRLDGKQDLAFVSYHMGVGNLETVIGLYGAEPDDDPPAYAQIYFDSTPHRHPEAHAKLASFGDESSGYFWKVLAAREIMRLFRTDPEELERRADAQLAKNSAEEILHPPGSTLRFDRPDTLKDAWEAGEIVAIPDDPDRLGLRRDRRMGELAPRIGQEPSLYQGLKPEALAMALYIGAQVRAISGSKAPLVITSGVRDDTYQRALVRRNSQATRNFSLHTTGYAVDIARRYGSRAQALAFQAVLDRLQALDLIAWVREPGAIHLTVSVDARAYLPLLDRIQPTE